MRIIRAHDQRAMPWKNGGGVTYEIAVFPEGAAIDAFDWRLSMADVKADGPFSMFPGIERSLGIVDGEGIQLRIDGQINMTVRRDRQPVTFAADAETNCILIAGPILDLNVMTRRASWSHHMSLRRNSEGLEATCADIRIVVVREGALSIETVDGTVTLKNRDAAVFTDEEVRLIPAPESGARFFQIDLIRHTTDRTDRTDRTAG
jgi:environmental stress-induced protein Ves